MEKDNLVYGLCIRRLCACVPVLVLIASGAWPCNEFGGLLLGDLENFWADLRNSGG